MSLGQTEALTFTATEATLVARRSLPGCEESDWKL